MNLGTVSSAASSGLAILQQRRALFGSNRRRLSRAATLASALFVALFGVVMLVMPVFRREVVVVELPERTVTILPEQLEEPPPVRDAADRPALEQVAVQQIADPPALPEHLALPPPRTRPEPEVPDNDASRMGRERARQVTAELASSTGALDRALRDLSASLKDAQAVAGPARAVRSRAVRGGRSDAQLPSAATGAAAAGRADLAGSRVAGERVAIGAPAAAPAGATEGSPASATAPGVYRSNASLLAVIRRYAAGIQYCYDGELKRDPALQGKLVVALTVASSGAVTDARVVQNTTGSAALATCALGQIRDWRFPAIPTGVTTFQTPFVFTPPQ